MELTSAEENYSKTSMSVLRVDAQATSVESALKGYMRWKVSHPQTNEMNVCWTLCGRLQVKADMCEASTCPKSGAAI